jgi:hypothetical protein
LGVSAFLLHGLLSEEECDFIISTVNAGSGAICDLPSSFNEDIGEDAENLCHVGPVKHTTKGEGHSLKDRFLFGSEELGRVLWNRMKPFFNEAVGEGIQVVRSDCAKANGFFDPSTGLAQSRIGTQAITAVVSPAVKLDVFDLGLTSGEEWLGEWRPAFCNPIFEVMSYPKGGCFRPHLDANLKYMERIQELQNEFEGSIIPKVDPDRVSSRSLYTIVTYLTGRRDENDEAPPFAGGETNLLENSYSEKLLYTDDDGNFRENAKRVFATVVPERGAALVFYQKGLLHEGVDLALDDLTDLPSTQSHLNKKIILRSDVFFQRTHTSDCRNSTMGQQDQKFMPSEADRAEADRLMEESEEYEIAGDYETAAELYQKALAILSPS